MSPQKSIQSKARQIITSYHGPRLRIMEVCGTHTHEIFRLGLRQLLPPGIDLISGPGCPVCVTPIRFIDEAIYLACSEHVTICTFGDLVRVPGTNMNLGEARAKGARVQVVYTPLDAVTYAQKHSDERIVFLSVGFETTTPASCLAVRRAKNAGLKNFMLLTANKTMDAAYLAMAKSCDAYLYPGHVCAITGTRKLHMLAEKNGISGAVAGFTASELLTALAVIIKNVQENRPFLINAYPRVVREDGNPAAQNLTSTYMQPCDAEWRGLGTMTGSGMELRPEYAAFDARRRFAIPDLISHANPACRCGDILQGRCQPTDCPLYGKVCTPDHPIGACMVSREGTCSAYYQYSSVASCDTSEPNTNHGGNAYV